MWALSSGSEELSEVAGRGCGAATKELDLSDDAWTADGWRRYSYVGGDC